MSTAPASGLPAHTEVSADVPFVAVARRSGAVVRLLRDRWAIAGAAVAVAFVLMAILAPVLSGITGSDPYTYHLGLLAGSGIPNGPFGGVSGSHWLGVEPQTGRDLFSIAAYGARISLLVGVGATLLATLIGTALGVIAGYSGGLVDTLLSRFTDLTIAFPQLVFMISLSALVPASFPKQYFMIFVIGAFGWPSVARVVRGQTMALRNRSFVVAARAVGAGPWHILRTEILPNLVSSILELIAQLQREFGFGCLFISHDLAVVRQVSRQVAVMREGRVVESGPTDQVLSHPEHEYTRTLLASIPLPDPDAQRATRAG